MSLGKITLSEDNADSDEKARRFLESKRSEKKSLIEAYHETFTSEAGKQVFRDLQKLFDPNLSAFDEACKKGSDGMTTAMAMSAIDSQSRPVRHIRHMVETFNKNPNQ